MPRKITPKRAKTRAIELTAWEATCLFHRLERCPVQARLPEEEALIHRLRALFDVDMNHRGRTAGADPYPARQVYVQSTAYSTIPGR